MIKFDTRPVEAWTASKTTMMTGHVSVSVQHEVFAKYSGSKETFWLVLIVGQPTLERALLDPHTGWRVRQLGHLRRCGGAPAPAAAEQHLGSHQSKLAGDFSVVAAFLFRQIQTAPERASEQLSNLRLNE